MNYYSDFDPTACEWLRELIRNNLIPKGDVDDRPIQDIRPGDLRGYTQCHFFAGIGGWPLALQLAGWPADRPVWTGSCPCQPYSAAGKQLGDADPRNVWPEFFRLIREWRPVAVFGEQVESAIRHGWLDGVCADLESEDYSFGACVLGAHSAGAPHIRQRLYWVADAIGERLEATGSGEAGRRPQPLGASRNPGELEYPASERREQRRAESSGRGALGGCGVGGVADAEESGGWSHAGTIRSGPAAGLRSPEGEDERGAGERSGRFGDRGAVGGWDGFDLIPCRDGKARRVEPGTFPLAHGVPGRVGLLRGYGNAIVPQAAAAFVSAFLEVINT